MQLQTYSKEFNDLTLSKFQRLAEEQSDACPDAFLLTDPDTLETQIRLEPPQFTRYVHVKFISSHSTWGDESIDVAMIAFVGLRGRATHVQSPQVVPPNLRLTIPPYSGGMQGLRCAECSVVRFVFLTHQQS